MTPDPEALDPAAVHAREISRDMANLYRVHFGRDPERTTTYFPSEDVVLVVLEDSMTGAEWRVAERGQRQALREARLATQLAAADEFRFIVEAELGRRVRAFTSAHDIEADVATETFVLHPA